MKLMFYRYYFIMRKDVHPVLVLRICEQCQSIYLLMPISVARVDMYRMIIMYHCLFVCLI